MASSLQSLFALPAFQDRYLTSFYTHSTTCFNPNPASCFECQMGKIADGLLSGRYSVPRQHPEDDADPGFAASAENETESKPKVVFQEGIRPSMFKALVGKDHPDFSTMKQQDAGEFLVYLLEVIRRSSKQEGTEDPTKIFGFALEERLQCTECKGVRYGKADQELLPIPVPVVIKKQPEDNMDVEADAKKEDKIEYEPVELVSCLESLTSPTNIEYKCPACSKNVEAVKCVASLPSLACAPKLNFPRA